MQQQHDRELRFLLDPKFAKLIDDRREYFIRMVSTSLLRKANYHTSSDYYPDELVKAMIQVADIEPEFILQTAYYVRHKMQIKTCTNFILAFSILDKQTQPFVAQYFNKTILIPGDLIEVCQFVQVINLINKGIAFEGIQDLRKKLYFPSFLRNCVASKLKEFSLYQLRKQCSDSNRKKTIREYYEFLNPLLAESRQAKRKAKLEAIHKAMIDTQNQDVIKQTRQHVKQRTGRGKKHTKAHKKPANEAPKNVFDMKDIIKFCYINEPNLKLQKSFQEIEMYLMGKKYPATPETFQQIKDEEIDLNSEQAGKRMQIPVPVTLDRELSLKKASKKHIWTDLLTKNQVPYKGMLRNLRNILKADLDVPTLKKVIETIQNPQKVQKSKISPFQYFNALSEVDKLLTGIEIDEENRKDSDDERNGIRRLFNRDSRKQVRCNKGVVAIGQEFKIRIQNQIPVKKQFDKILCPSVIREPRTNVRSNKMEQETPKNKTPEFKLNEEIGQELKIAIQNALQIAVEKNIDDILGKTYVFCDVSDSMSAGKKFGSIKTCKDCGIVLGLMIKQKCQKCELYLFGSPNLEGVSSLKCDVDTNILEGFKRCQEMAKSIGGGTQLGKALGDVLLRPKAFADTIIILSRMTKHHGFWGDGSLSFEEVIKGYLSNVNPNAKFLFMNIQGYGVQVQYGDDLKGKNCIVISGMSDNVLRYISLAGSVDQVQDVWKFTQNAFQNQQMQQEEPSANQ